MFLYLYGTAKFEILFAVLIAIPQKRYYKSGRGAKEDNKTETKRLKRFFAYQPCIKIQKEADRFPNLNSPQ